MSEKQVAGLWVRHGGPINQAAMAVAVATAESGRDTDVENKDSGATGLWQIHPGGAQYKDPHENAKVAVAKWRERGWVPWSVCGSHAWDYGTPNCPKLAGKANAVARRIGAPRVGSTQPVKLNLANPWESFLDKLGVGGPLEDAQDAVGGAASKLNPVAGIKAVAVAIQDIFELIKSVIEKLADPNTWADLLKMFVGLILLYMGLKRTFQLTK